MDKVILNNGVEVPALCFGPGIMCRGRKTPHGFLQKCKNHIEFRILERRYYEAVLSAFKCGLRFVDYSAAYGREDLISKAIRNSGIDRKEFILTTRITNGAQLKGNVREAFFQSLKRYGVDYIDVLMFHWPVTDVYVDTFKEMIKLRDEGYVRTLAVANCHKHHLERIINETGVVPSINQVEIHPLFSQKKLISDCQDLGITMEAYTPLSRFDERMTRLPLLKNIAAKYHKSLSQIILRWHYQNGVIPVFRSLNPERQRENVGIFDFELAPTDMQSIDSININSRLRYDPDNCDFSIL